MKKYLIDRLNARSELVTESGCRIWVGAVKPGGYGHMSYQGKLQMVHRLAWESAHGPVPSGLLVCHRCDVRCCLNVDHLFLGTPKENIRDAVQKGRMRRGVSCGNAKLTVAEVLAIRADLRPLKQISRQYGVCGATVSLIRHKHTWKTAA